MICPFCKANIKSDQVFCDKCGQIIKNRHERIESVSSYWSKIEDENRLNALFSTSKTTSNRRNIVYLLIMIFILMIAAICYFFLVRPVLFANVTANPITSQVTVNGQAISFEAYEIDGNNYFKIRDLAMAMANSEKQFEVQWDSGSSTVNLIRNHAYTAVGGELVSGNIQQRGATASKDKFSLDGETINLKTYIIEDDHYVRLRDLGEVLDFGVSWDSETQTIIIDTTIGYSKD